jgi:hypothetical protein
MNHNEIKLMLDTYDDIFSDFDPRPFSQRTLSEDFLEEARKASREKEMGNIEQINVTPIRKIHFIIGKLLTFWLIAFVMLGFGLCVGRLLFNVSITKFISANSKSANSPLCSQILSQLLCLLFLHQLNP